MNRPFYSDYVRHALRFYTRNMYIDTFNSESDRDNWFSCQTVLIGYQYRERDMLIKVYRSKDTLSDSVYETAKEYGINQSVIWDMMKDVERKIAKRRGLI